MMKLTLAEISKALEGRLEGAASVGTTEVSEYSIDTRTIEPGALFFALVGPNHDAHRFVPKAFESGAAAAVVHAVPATPAAGPLVHVKDTTRALQDLSTYVRRRINPKVVAITGSAGKTTTRAMTQQVVSTLGPTLGSPGNLNNLYGLPLALLHLQGEHRYAVLEAAMSRPGELARLAEICDPDIGTLINVGPAHIEFFGTLEKIAATKEELFLGMRPGTVAVMNADDARVMAIAGRFARRGGSIVSFGLEREADVRGEGVEFHPQGLRVKVAYMGKSAELELKFLGAHFLSDALAALATGIALGGTLVQLCGALSEVEPLDHRGRLLELPGDVRLLDDCYNSNPVALEEALRALGQLAPHGRRLVVAGDMLELGALESEAHRSAGERIARSGIDVFFGVGKHMRTAVEAARAVGHKSAHHFADSGEAAVAITNEIKPRDTILVKGSRGLRLEKVIEALMRTRVRG
ncbi:MAG: UDP-N-acetylmuramoyl-tripeptide--D-alanyl-D-alanine ligase [Acidobacteria bacterium]|nr:UDP-N-acetylmuramoyl-tripeptide--D-alanyl-D-alanine ligase [Acidobacteriota bacterium]